MARINELPFVFADFGDEGVYKCVEMNYWYDGPKEMVLQDLKQHLYYCVHVFEDAYLAARVSKDTLAKIKSGALAGNQIYTEVKSGTVLYFDHMDSSPVIEEINVEDLPEDLLPFVVQNENEAEDSDTGEADDSDSSNGNTQVD